MTPKDYIQLAGWLKSLYDQQAELIAEQKKTNRLLKTLVEKS